MKPELYWLTLTCLMTALFWAPYVLNRMVVNGLLPTLGFGDKPLDHAPWAARAKSAHANAVENLVIFAAVVLTAQALGVSTPVTAGAAMVYFFARLVHFVVYALGLPVLRTLAFAVAWGAQIAIIASILRWI